MYRYAAITGTLLNQIALQLGNFSGDGTVLVDWNACDNSDPASTRTYLLLPTCTNYRGLPALVITKPLLAKRSTEHMMSMHIDTVSRLLNLKHVVILKTFTLSGTLCTADPTTPKMNVKLNSTWQLTWNMDRLCISDTIVQSAVWLCSNVRMLSWIYDHSISFSNSNFWPCNGVGNEEFIVIQCPTLFKFEFPFYTWRKPCRT